MRKTINTILFFLIILAILYPLTIYNRLVTLDQRVKESWAQVENVLQRRNDLIPNLVETVKGYAVHEQDVLLHVTEARTSWLNAKGIPEKAAAAGDIERSLNRLLVTVENYPQIRASENFMRLQDELAGAENRIAIERMRYNEAVREYNRIAKSLPTVIFVRKLNFDAEKQYFEATPESKSPPKVRFDKSKEEPAPQEPETGGQNPPSNEP